MRKISIAFQGGGARLISLIAAAHAISELEQANVIKVESISGSSAGSIAALLLASGVEFEKVRDAIRKSNRKIQDEFPSISNKKLGWRVLLFMLFGWPIYKPAKFNSVVSDIMSKSGIDVTKSISEIANNRKLYIFKSDIYQGKSISSDPSETVAAALRVSCAIPIVFASFKQDDGGQHVDGGVFDNLPTEVLLPATGEAIPVFAIGFKSEALTPAKSAWDYIYKLASSVVTQRTGQSRQLIGQERIFEIGTSMGTLDFNKIVSVGLDREYSTIKESTKQFFRSWLAGVGNFDDPYFDKKGSAPYVALRQTQESVISFVESSLKEVVGTNEYVRLRVNAHCLVDSSKADEIEVEQLTELPADKFVSGIILPLTDGDGYNGGMDCHVHLDGPDGPIVPVTVMIVHDEVPRNNALPRQRTRLLILLNGDTSSIRGRKLYIFKREYRYGFMLALNTKQEDWLGCRSHYWPAKEVSIQLNVPQNFPDLRPTFVRSGVDASPSPVTSTVRPALVPGGFKAYFGALENVPVGSGLQATFKVT